MGAAAGDRELLIQMINGILAKATNEQLKTIYQFVQPIAAKQKDRP